MIVVDPPPLNSEVFPFGVQEFPALELRDFAGLFRGERAEATEVNPLRYEP